MITIRSSESLPETALIGLEATLTAEGRVYTFSSHGPVMDNTSPFAGGVFGAMSWPRSRFKLTPSVTLEQQMFLSHDGSGAAFSWELCGGLISAQLVVRPFFSGCSPRSYRDVGFRLEPQEHGGRLAWLPSVTGPRIIADTNGSYYDEPARFAQGNTIAFSSDNLVAPGTFDFQLSNRPSVLIISRDGAAKTHGSRNVGAFLAGLIPKSDFTPQEREVYPSASLVEAA
jgi:hypothetical protein